MRATTALAVITGGVKSSAPFSRSIMHAPPARERSMQAMLAVTLVHMAALAWILYHPVTASQQPVISFSVTLMDLSASQNTVSSAASTASVLAAKPEPKKTAEEIKSDTRAAKPKKIVKPVPIASANTSSPLSHNSQAQTAVLAPLTPAAFDAAYLQNPKPAYPALSRRMGEQGSVLLSVYVTEDGRAQSIKIKQSSGFERLDSAASEAVSRWRFASAKQGETLLASWVQVPVKFVLE